MRRTPLVSWAWLAAAAMLWSVLAASLLARGAEVAQAGVAADPRKPATAAAARKDRRQRLSAVTSWGYQLRFIEPAEVAAAPFDLVVVDHAISANRRFLRQFTADEVRQMKTRTDGGPRILLAYLSIGEAERYRFYWNQDWYQPETRPPWLGEVNPRWDGNFPVQFWHPDWQTLIFGRPDAYLERIMAAGFDGIYLDRADVYSELLKQNPKARGDMIAFVGALSASARRANPDFLVVMQNAEELIQHKSLRDALDGVAKEDLFYGVDHAERANPAAMVSGSLADLRLARRSGLTVLAVEYLSDSSVSADLARRMRREGFTFLVTERSLGTLIHRPDPPIGPALQQPAAPQPQPVGPPRR